MAGNDLHVGDLDMQATGSINLASHGELTTVAAVGDEGSLLLAAQKAAAMTAGSTALVLENDEIEAGSISLQAGPEGKIVIALGPIELGARIVLAPESLTIAVGLPGVGASIQLTPESITLRVAENQIDLSPEGLEEQIAEVIRSVTPEGQVIEAGETVHSIGLTGEEIEAPTQASEALAAADISGAMLDVAGEGMLSEEAPIIMIN
jgi:hypothetical protein